MNQKTRISHLLLFDVHIYHNQERAQGKLQYSISFSADKKGEFEEIFCLDIKFSHMYVLVH